MRPNEAAGKSILLRSNLTVHNTLKCHLYLLLESAHDADALGNRVWKLMRPDQTYNIPLHLTNQVRVRVRVRVSPNLLAAPEMAGSGR